MTKDIREKLKEQFSNKPLEFYEVTTFKDLKIGDKYIALPMPGDNKGSGGFNGGYYLLMKIKSVGDFRDTQDNTIRIKDGSLFNMTDDKPVIEIKIK